MVRCAAVALSLDQLSCAIQYTRWNGHANLLGGFQIDDELKPCRLLYGEVTGLCSFEDLVNVGRNAKVALIRVRGVAHEAAGMRPRRRSIHSRKLRLLSELSSPCSVRIHPTRVQDNEGIGAFANSGLKRLVQILWALAAHRHRP